MGKGKRAPARPLSAEGAAVFLAELGTSGNAARAATAAGVGASIVYRRRARDASFAAEWEAALGRAAARISNRRAGEASAPDTIRRQNGQRQDGGRLRLTAPRANEWTARIERDFLDNLSATANARAAARAAGVSASGAWLRRRRMPAFARAWDEAVDDGHALLEMLLMQRGAALLGGTEFVDREHEGARATVASERDEEARDRTAREAFDPYIAMWLLKRRDQARSGTVKRGAGWRRQPTIDEVRVSIGRKLEAIRRARERGPRPEALAILNGTDAPSEVRPSPDADRLDTRTRDS